MTDNSTPWKCEGVKKDGAVAPTTGKHTLVTVDGDECPKCFLRREEVVPDGRKMPPIGKIGFSASAIAIVALLGFGLLRLWPKFVPSLSSETRRTEAGFKQVHSSAVLSLALTPDGQTLFSSGADTTIQVWNVEERNLIDSFDEHYGRVNDLAVAPQGGFLVSGGGDGYVRVWNLTTSSQAKALPARKDNRENPKRVLSVAVSPDDKYIAAGTDSGLIYVWDISTYNQIAAFCHESSGTTSSCETAPIQDIAFNPANPNHLAVARDGGSLDVWEFVPKNGDANIRYSLLDNDSLSDDTNRSFSVAISPDGQTVAIGNYTGKIFLWDMKTGEERTLSANGHRFIVSSLNISQDGKLLVSSGYDEAVHVWDYLSTGDPHLHSIREHSGFVYSALLTPDNSAILSGGLDTKIHFTPLQEGREEDN